MPLRIRRRRRRDPAAARFVRRDKRDRRQRILQLVRDAARDFMPGRGLLGAQQLAGVFEHHHEIRAKPDDRAGSAETVTARCRTCHLRLRPEGFQIDLAGRDPVRRARFIR